ncbi:Pyruvate dehyrogenase phosphatase catalytic subunit, partial [Kappamyces sp. JEL0680]
HWSGDCSHFVAQALPVYISNQLKCDAPASKADFIKAFDDLDRAILQLPWTLAPRLMNQEPARIIEAPVEERAKILEDSFVSFTGACSLIAHIKDDILHVAHAGDCRAVLGSYDPIKRELKAKGLTEDHQPGNLREQSRILKEHPGEDDTAVISSEGGPSRVLGVLMPSRAFGDGRFKYSLRDQEQLDALKAGIRGNPCIERPYHLMTPPYITARPDVLCHRIQPTDQFLVLSTDGIFDMLTNRDVVRHVYNFIKGRTVDSNAATHLIRHAIQNGQGQDFVAYSLSLPARQSRLYRDDMTVQVVFLNNSLSSPLASALNVMDAVG